MSTRDNEIIDLSCEIIDLSWEGQPDFWAVRGHVDGAIAEAWARKECEWRDVDPPERFYTLHTHARWQFLGGWDEDRTRRTLVLSRPGRGAFKVTIAEELDRE